LDASVFEVYIFINDLAKASNSRLPTAKRTLLAFL